MDWAEIKVMRGKKRLNRKKRGTQTGNNDNGMLQIKYPWSFVRSVKDSSNVEPSTFSGISSFISSSAAISDTCTMSFPTENWRFIETKGFRKRLSWTPSAAEKQGMLTPSSVSCIPM